MTSGEELVHRVVSALAAADGVEPLQLDYALTDYVDPIVVERIASGGAGCEVTFRVPSHEVTVTGAGEIFVDGVRYRPGEDPSFRDWAPDVPLGLERVHRRRLLDQLPSAVYRSRNEPGWPIDFISERCREITGYDPNSFVVGGVTFGFDLIHPDDRERVDEAVAEAVRNEEPFTLVYRIRTADGAEKRVLERGVALFDEADPLPFVGVITDVTGLKLEPNAPRDVRA